MDSKDILVFDKSHIWHPYTSLTKPLPCYHVKSANGVRIKLADGSELIDGMSSWWCAIHGYNNSELNQAAHEQIDKMSHVMFGGLTHDPAVSLVSKLLKMTHPKLECCFLADSGSVSVEVSLKMAIQYFHALDKPQKKRFLTISNGYHGDTFGAMSVCDPVNSMHSLYAGYMSYNIFAKAPQIGYFDEWDDSDFEDFKIKLEGNHHEIAAVILEPILQGAGGMRMYHPMFLVKARKLCDNYGILLIFDEIATGFGRTGRLFGYQHANVVPDILLIGKAITGGYMSLAAVVCQRFVADTIGSDPETGGLLMHGPTFMANPLACSVATKSLEIIDRGDWEVQVDGINKQLQSLRKVAGLPVVEDVRVLGAIGVVQLNNKVDMAWFQKRFVERGVWIRPFGSLVYIMPPYIISREDLEKLIDSLVDVVESWNNFTNV
jgi:adenosylmethionine-8-amino-7-oxononanoate aminotransferase